MSETAHFKCTCCLFCPIFFYMYSSWRKIDEYVDAEYAHCIKVSFVTEHGDSLVWKTSLVAFSKRI